MTDIVMPRLSDTMEEGTILRWLKHDGEHVRRGEELVEIETDKANMTYESDRDGVLHTLAQEGDTLAVGEPIAQIGGEGGGASAVSGAIAHRAGGEGQTSVAVGEPAAGSGEQAMDGSPAGKGAPAGNGSPAARGERVRASPLARRLARQSGVDLASLTGSGPGGRIVKADVEASAPAAAPAGGGHAQVEREHVQQPPMPPSAVPPATQAPGQPQAPEPHADMAARGAPTVGEVAAAKGESVSVELSRTQRTIARRMAESKATIPHFTLQTEVDMERCAELRGQLKRLAEPSTGAVGGRPGDGQAAVPTYNDMIVKACSLALREHPRANGSYRDGRFELHSRVNVGVAVAVDADDPLHSALVVPTVFDADRKALGEIARETRTLAARVRDGSITPPELSGGTFTVSNLGMYGVSSFTAIVNPPQAAILAVGAVEQRAVAHEGQPAVRHRMTIALSCDHRILYGADAALFLARIRELLAQPAALTL